MSPVEGKTTDEFEQIRNRVRYLIANPVNNIAFDRSRLISDTLWDEFGQDIATLPNLSLKRAKRLFTIIREEVYLAHQRGIKLDRFLSEVAVNKTRRKRVGQDILDHELAHLERADQLGVNLMNSRLIYTFTYDNYFGLGLFIQFDPPNETDIYSLCLICLATEKLSAGDLSLLVYHARLLTVEQRETIHQKYALKLGFDIQMFGPKE